MQSRASIVLGAVAFVLAGVVVGFLADRWASSSNEAERPSIVRPAPNQDLTPALSSLQRAVEELSRTMRSKSGTEPETATTRTPDAPAVPPFDRLATAIEHLNELLSSGAGRALGRQVVLDAWKGPGLPSKEALSQRIEGAAAARPQNWQDKLDPELTRAHLAWTLQDVFERYGAPTVLDSGDHDGLQLNYHLGTNPDNPRLVMFTVVQGLVTRVWCGG
jgi:hypothetical protein